jgi:hypothetical protein
LTGNGKSSKMREDGTTAHATVSVEGKIIPFAEWDTSTGFSACGE